MRYHSLIVILDEEDIINGLIKLSLLLISKCTIVKQVESESDYLAQKLNNCIFKFVKNILNDLAKVIGFVFLIF